MSAYTRGPWSVSARFSADEVNGADGAHVASTRGPHLHEKRYNPKKHWAASPGSHVERSDNEEFANARLIAAAPELLEALVAALPWVERALEDAGFAGPAANRIPALIRAAITKATGAQP